MSNIKKLIILALVLFPGAVLADSDSSAKPNPTEIVLTVKPIPDQIEKLDLASLLSLSFIEPKKKEPTKATIPKPPEPVMYEVKEGDTLYTIAEPYKIAWTRVYDANTQVESPELIHPGDKLRIPDETQKLEARELPVMPNPVHSNTLATTTSQNAPTQAYSGATSQDGLVGSYGYALSGGNCVNMANRYGKNQPGNPISWIPTTQTPFIGAAVLFYFNHVAIVTGIHYDGSVEVAHENCPNCPTRYPVNTFRGFF